MIITPGTDVTVKIPNARVAKYDHETDRYFVHSPAFYGGAWVDASNVTPPREQSGTWLDQLAAHSLTTAEAKFGPIPPKETP